MKTITIPINTDAMARLDYGQSIEGDLKELELTHSAFYAIWQSGFFMEINIALDVMIDDYEDEEIIGEKKLLKLREVIIKFIDLHQEIKEFREILSKTDEAITYKTGVFFFF